MLHRKWHMPLIMAAKQPRPRLITKNLDKSQSQTQPECSERRRGQESGWTMSKFLISPINLAVISTTTVMGFYYTACIRCNTRSPNTQTTWTESQRNTFEIRRRDRWKQKICRWALRLELFFLWLHIWMTDDYVTNFLFGGRFSSFSSLKGDT